MRVERGDRRGRRKRRKKRRANYLIVRKALHSHNVEVMGPMSMRLNIAQNGEFFRI